MEKPRKMKKKANKMKTTIQKAIKIALLRLEEAKRNAKMEWIKAKHKEKHITKTIQGNTMHLDKEDKGISKDLLLDGIKEEEPTKELRKRIKPGTTIADIGANIGYYALIEAQQTANTIYAIEPVPENIKLLKKNIEANGRKNIETHQTAIGNKEGLTAFHTSKKSNLGSITNTHKEHKKETITTKITTLDKFLKGKKTPNTIRMDVEGYELEIIKGAKETLKKPETRQLFIEMHAETMGKQKTMQLLKTLQKHGFNKTTIIHELPQKLKAIKKWVPKQAMPKEEKYETTLKEIIKKQEPTTGIYHLFTEKEEQKCQYR